LIGALIHKELEGNTFWVLPSPAEAGAGGGAAVEFSKSGMAPAWTGLQKEKLCSRRRNRAFLFSA
jgi:hypothetical protein